MNNGKKEVFFRRPKFREGLFLVALVAIPIVHFAVFWVYINIQTIINTFQKFNIVKGEMEWIGFTRYVNMFKSYVLGLDGAIAERNTFWNSFKAIAINVIIFPLAITSAYAFYKKIRFEKYFRICFYLPQLISVTVLVTMYKSMFHADFGPLKLFFEHVLNYSPGWLTADSEVMWTLIFIFCIWCGLGSNVIMVSGAMARIPADIGEYCQLEGVGFWRELFQIVLPLVMSTVGVYIINITCSVFGFAIHPMLVAEVMGVENRFYTVGWFIFESVKQGSESGILQASTLGLILTVIMLPVVIGVRVAVKKCTPDVQF